MLLDSIYKRLCTTKAKTPLAQRLLSIFCKKLLEERGGLLVPRFGLILVEDKPYIWEVNNLTFSHAYMTKASKRKLRQPERAGGTKSNIEESQHRELLITSIKAKLLMILLLLLLLLTSLTGEWLYRKLEELNIPLKFNMKVSTIPKEKAIKTDNSDGSQLSLPEQ